MPWTVADVERHNKGLSDKKKRQWVAVANDVLERTGSDAQAIKAANAAVRESGDYSIRDDIDREKARGR